MIWLDHLYLEINASCINLGARLLQVRDGMIYRGDEAPVQLCDQLNLPAKSFPMQSGPTAT